MCFSAIQLSLIKNYKSFIPQKITQYTPYQPPKQKKSFDALLVIIKVEDKIYRYFLTQGFKYLVVYLDKVAEVNVPEREYKSGIPGCSHDIMALFSSCGVLLHVTNDCQVCALFVVTCRDSFGVECREHGWEWRGQFVFSARVLYGAWAAWAIKALAPALNK